MKGIIANSKVIFQSTSQAAIFTNHLKVVPPS